MSRACASGGCPGGCSGRCRALRQAAGLWRGGMEALARGEDAQAEAMQRQALEMVRGLGGFAVLQARIHNNLGVVLACSGRGAEAVGEFARALRLVRGRVDPDSQFHRVLARNHGRAAAGLPHPTPLASSAGPHTPLAIPQSLAEYHTAQVVQTAKGGGHDGGNGRGAAEAGALGTP